MAKYLWQASYTSEGVKGLLKDGGTGRRKAAEELAASVGGKIEAFYFAFGDTDVYAIVDFADNVAASAAALTVAGSGMVNVRTTVLMSPEEVDKALKAKVKYRAPGAK